VKPIANFALEVTVIHALIALEVTDDDLNRLAPLEQRSFSLADPFTFPRRKMRISGLFASTPRPVTAR
jgi:hypothetical protein